MQAKNKMLFGYFANPRDLIFFKKNEAKKVFGVSLLFRLEFNEFHFCKQHCQDYIMDKNQETYK